MMDIKKFAAGVIARAAITAAPLMAFAAPASAATDASNRHCRGSNPRWRVQRRRPERLRWRLIFRAHLALRWRHAL